MFCNTCEQSPCTCATAQPQLDNSIVLVCNPLQSGTGYCVPDGTTIPCSQCNIICMMSPASRTAWLADHPDLPHQVLCIVCLYEAIKDKPGIEVALPSADMRKEIQQGLDALRASRQSQTGLC